MKIAIINENSQASKNKIIYDALKPIADKKGFEVYNYGMENAEENNLTYVQAGLLAAILINSKAADFIITGCGTGEGAMLALNSFPTKNVILIAGGYDKNLDYNPIAKPIANSCKSIILIGQTADKIEKCVSKEIKHGVKDVNIYRCKNLEETVLLAQKIATKGDVVLFSPASASFDMFKDMYDRGKQFKNLVIKHIN